MKPIAAAAVIRIVLFSLTQIATGDSPLGYYRPPALHGDTIVFVAEGNLWKVSAEGGVALRLTCHQGRESGPAISPDGRTLALCLTAPHSVPSRPREQTDTQSHSPVRASLVNCGWRFPVSTR